MNTISKWTMALALLSGAAYGQVPNTNDTTTTDGKYNTGMGTGALGGPTPVNLTGYDNTASGFQALFSNTTGYDNTASGNYALVFNTTGYDNAASGGYALFSNTTGYDNTASGASALFSNTTGNYNTASGYHAMDDNTTGSYNTAIGFQTLLGNTTGGYTTAVGAYALEDITTGGYDTALGAYALSLNTTGVANAAFGYAALRSTTTGNSNIGFGFQALYQDATGSNNIAMGYQAAYNLYNGSNTIEIGNMGGPGDNNLIRIGSTQTVAYIAGIAGNHITGSAVYVTSGGQLGVLASSERYKTSIAPMGAGNTEKLQRLRPVSFHLRSDPKGAVQYGLIAEEVDKVYPELVIRDEAGKMQGVRYDELAPMLLNEIQKQAAEIRDLKQQEQDKIAAQDAKIRRLEQQVAELTDLKQEMRAALLKPQSKDQLVAQR